ncbi:hypothetical protein [uncultured Sphingomonas sp.]|uniref:hypothetical protein n=1 Tax=uncultured Sphingomonas sp. TaxID=158754 RepID=UPI0030F53AAA
MANLVGGSTDFLMEFVQARALGEDMVQQEGFNYAWRSRNRVMRCAFHQSGGQLHFRQQELCV